MTGKLSQLKNMILLDTGSILKATIMNPNLIKDIIMSRNTVVTNINYITNMITLAATLK